MKTQGTPKTLTEAIERRLAKDKDFFTQRDAEYYARIVTPYVVDFLAQAFNAAMLAPDTSQKEEQKLLALFKKITDRE